MLKKFIRLYNERNNLDFERYSENNYILCNKILKTITFLPAKILSNLNISANLITLISYVLILLSCLFFVFGKLNIAIYTMILFILFDSLDGDIARLQVQKNSYGKVLDTFGADIFYLTIPFCISYYIYDYQQELSYLIDRKFLILVAIGLAIKTCGLFKNFIYSSLASGILIIFSLPGEYWV